MKKLLIIVVALIAILGGGVVILVYQAGNIVEAGIERYGPTVLGTPVTIDGVDISLIGGTATMSGFAVANPPTFSDAPALAAESTAIELSPMSVFTDRIEIQTVHVQKPQIRLEISPKGTNLDVIRRQVQKYTESMSGEPSQTTVRIDELRITGTTVSASAADIGKRTEFTLPDIVLKNLDSADGTAAMTRRIVDAVYVAVFKKMKSEAVIAKVGDIFGNANVVREEMKRTVEEIKESIDDRARKQLEGLFD